jgi:uncharacterized SAM-binding protein YcdF (DUF218 family)
MNGPPTHGSPIHGPSTQASPASGSPASGRQENEPEAVVAPDSPLARPTRLTRGRLALPALGGLALLWLAGLVWFADTMPSAIGDPDTTTDAVVVLTGGSQRFDSGLDLLVAGKAKKLFVSGVHPGVEIADLLHLAHHAPDAQKIGELACCIVLGHAADSTIGNALETASWMRREGYRSLRLVTAGYHMRRSLFEFARAMPDVRIIANPVFPEQVKQANWWIWPGTAALIIGEYDKYLAARLRAALGEAAVPPAS